AGDFNSLVLGWLQERLIVREHRPPAAFTELRHAYDLEVDNVRAISKTRLPTWQAHKAVLSNLTELMLGHDVTGLLSKRLSAESINPGGFRTALAQGVAKNTGENFINAITYGLAACLAHQDVVLVDKGLPPPLRPFLEFSKRFTGRLSGPRAISIKLES